MRIQPLARKVAFAAALLSALVATQLAAATLEVRVLGPQGEALEATLRLLPEELATSPAEARPESWTLPAERLAEGGAARFETLEQGRYRLRVEHPDFAAQTLPDLALHGELRSVDVTLSLGRTLDVTLIDRSGVPIGGAFGVACDATAAPFGRAGCRRATSSLGGKLLFENMGDEAVLVGASSDRHAWSELSIPRRQREALLQLQDGAPIAGQLRDRQGAALPFTPVLVERIVRNNGYDRERLGPPLMTDGEGRFRHPGVSPGFYALRAARRGWHGFFSRAYAGRGGTTEVELSADRAAAIQFELVDDSGEPLESEVELRLDARRKQDHFLEDALQLTRRTDESGRLEIDAVPPTTATLQIFPRGHLPIEIAPFAYQPGERYELGSLTVTAATQLEGRVEDNEGRPVAGATIVATMLFEDGSETTTTVAGDREGLFRFEHLSLSQPIRFEAQAHGYEESTRTVDPERERDELTEGLILELPQRSGLFGVAVAPDGSPIQQFRLRLHPVASSFAGASAVGSRRWNSYEAADGRFVLAPIYVGDYLLELEAPGYAAGRVELQVEAGRLTDVGEVTVESGERLVGRVTDFAGVGISTALIEILELEESTTSDGEGEFEFSGLEPGQWSFVVRHPEYAEHSERLPITAESFDRGVTILMGRGGSLRGRAVQEGQPVDVEIALRPQGGRVKPRTGATEAGGEFYFEQLAAGSYRLSAFGPDGVSFIKPRWITIVENEETTVLLDADAQPQIQGRATVGGQPLPYASITFSRQTPVTDDLGSATTDENGHYEMTLPEAGHYRARIDGGGQLLRRVPFTVRGSGQQRQDFHIEGGSISGTVRDSAGEPVGAEVTALVASTSRLDGMQRARSRASDGHFEFNGLAPGSYRIAAQAQGRDSVEVGPIELGERPLEGIELVLEEDKPLLRGRVIDPFGLATANAIVLAIPSGQPHSLLHVTVASDARGAFELRSPVNGAIDLFAFAPGFAPGRLRNWTAREGGTDSVQLQLTEGAALNVLLLDASGDPITGRFATVVALPPTPVTEMQATFMPPMPSGPDGISRHRGLLPGRYLVRGPWGASAEVQLGERGEGYVELREPNANFNAPGQ